MVNHEPYAPSLQWILDAVNQPMPKRPNTFVEPKQLNNNICIRNLSFIYPGCSVPVLNNINLEIKKGERIGIIGPTGSGKSTLIDLLMGLFSPTSGEILVDGIKLSTWSSAASSDNYALNDWMSSISHVPQSIFLSDGSIAQNIAFGLNEENIDYDLVKRCAKLANISAYIEQTDKGYDTFVGERGVRLSGGQRQRWYCTSAFSGLHY